MMKLREGVGQRFCSSEPTKDEDFVNWIIDKFLMCDPKRFVNLKSDLSDQIIRMPEIEKRNLKFDIEEALFLDRDITRFAQEIINKNYIH